MSESSGKRVMTADHKAAIAEGRKQSRAVGDYLAALVATKPKRGRRRTTESIEARLKKIDESIEKADPLTAVNLRQLKRDLTADLEKKNTQVDLYTLESGFIEFAAAYGERKGISFAVWRESGVTADVLSKAGIQR